MLLKFKIFLIFGVFCFSGLYSMNFFKRFCCCRCCKDKDEFNEEFEDDVQNFITRLQNSSTEEIDQEMEEFAKAIKDQTVQARERLRKFFKNKRSKFKKWIMQHKKKNK